MSEFTSYAQNYEDVMLWRALRHVRQGYYVDVGANDPTFDSVTYAFYLRGWRGINIEPMDTYYEALCRVRPGDINLPVAVGAEEGELTFYEVPETGISSAVAEAVFENKYLPGHQVIERKVPATTLNKIFEDYVHSQIHFLKIDVEGYENVVLQGLDLRRWRPWILVLEATIPNSKEQNPDFPHDALAASGYTFAYFDGLNRFYVAEEHAELLPAFAAPPNVFDYFSRIDLETANAEKAAARAQAEELRQHATALQGELQWTRNTATFLQEEINRARAEQAAQRQQMELRSTQFNTQLAAARAETEAIRAQYINVLYSRSYRITAPLRAFYVLAARGKAWLRRIFSGAGAVNPQQASSSAVDLDEVGQYYLKFFQREIQSRRHARKDA